MENEKPRLLIVEDSANERFLIKCVFNEEEWELLEAEDGLQGLALATKSQPDLILLDVQMPRMSGIEMLKCLRADSRTKDLLVIVLTGNATKINDLEEGFSIGADEYLFKPFNIDELRIRVNGMLKRRRAEKALQQLQSDFIAMLIHDLKSPLTAISGFSDLLLQRRLGELNDRQTHCIQTTLTACHKMLKIVNEALDLSKFEAGKFILTKAQVDLLKVLIGCFERLQPVAEQHGVSFDLQLPESLPMLEVDGDKIDQVVTNLLSNALKFTPNGGNVKLVAELVTDNGLEFVQVSTIDSGSGIPKDEQAILFQKYQQTTTGRMMRKGTGLGLAICKSIIDAHDGKIWVESQSRVGSSFIFTLPLHVTSSAV